MVGIPPASVGLTAGAWLAALGDAATVRRRWQGPGQSAPQLPRPPDHCPHLVSGRWVKSERSESRVTAKPLLTLRTLTEHSSVVGTGLHPRDKGAEFRWKGHDVRHLAAQLGATGSVAVSPRGRHRVGVRRVRLRRTLRTQSRSAAGDRGAVGPRGHLVRSGGRRRSNGQRALERK